jgi:hypothetical protein
MRARSSTPWRRLAVAGAVVLGVAGAGNAGAESQTPSEEHLIPQSQILEHQENLERLSALSQHPGKVGEVARKAVAMFKQHDAREAEYIMPPLSLLPDLAEGKVTPDMRWVLVMADRVNADREVIFTEHTRMIDVLNDLQSAARQANDTEALNFAHDAAVDALNDLEILEPTTVMIGNYLRARLATAP